MRKNITVLAMLVFSTSLITGCWAAAGAVGAEAGYVAAQDDRSAGETIDDQTILAAVKSKLIADQEVSGLSINVDVHKGIVTLRGYIQTQSEINRAIQLTRSVNGVKSVESKLVLDK